jgi:hypothetical protein
MPCEYFIDNKCSSELCDTWIEAVVKNTWENEGKSFEELQIEVCGKHPKCSEDEK